MTTAMARVPDSLRGQIVTPGDRRYAQLRSTYTTTASPASVLLPKNAAQVGADGIVGPQTRHAITRAQHEPLRRGAGFAQPEGASGFGRCHVHSTWIFASRITLPSLSDSVRK